MNARAIMVLGCTSGAGKTWLTTALCRWYARRGLRVAPYKAQNMSNHARVVSTPDGTPGEIGSAQYFQALAAGIEPDVRMNPVLLKPESDQRSQVIAMGKVRPFPVDCGWRERSRSLAVIAAEAYTALAEQVDLIVIEGAGSPAETNLADCDYVNLDTARRSAARCLLVSDIDRGGSFAHLYGTHQLMPADVRAQLAGFVLNRFRGDAALLAPAPQDLERLTGVPTLAVVPYVHAHGLPEEDALPASRAGSAGPRVAVLAGPAASNLDEFETLASSGVSVDYVRHPAAARQADILILPGSKQARIDLEWLQRSGLDEVVRSHARGGRPVLGICGGLQVLGSVLDDPLGLEGLGPARVAGLGVLSASTVYTGRKTLCRAQATFTSLHGCWQPLSGLTVDGYEIHLGQAADVQARSVLTSADGHSVGWQQGSVFGTYLHGLLESPAVLQALFGVTVPALEAVFDRLADTVSAGFSPGALDRLIAI